MIESLPLYISIVFIFTVLLTLLMLYWIIRSSSLKKIKERSAWILLLLIGWLILQAVLTLKGVYYQDLEVLPPRLLLFGILPNIVLIALLFLTQNGRRFIDSLSMEKYTYLHVVRIPVEFVLLWLSLSKVIPESMTFEGWNYDIAMGISAPLVGYLVFRRKTLGKRFLLIWNVLGVVLLTNVVVIALLSAPFPLQQLAFDQPNIGVLYFPFSLLPNFVVPAVMLGHFVSIRQLIRNP